MSYLDKEKDMIYINLECVRSYGFDFGDINGRAVRVSWNNDPGVLQLKFFRCVRLNDYIEDINNITETERSLLLLNESIELIEGFI